MGRFGPCYSANRPLVAVKERRSALGRSRRLASREAPGVRMRGVSVRRGSARASAAAVIFLLGCARGAAAQGFFDGLPAKGYVKNDVSLDVLNAGSPTTPVARIRYVTLVLDPGTRDIARDYWPEREMLLVEHASGERLVFERIAKLAQPVDPSALQPRGRIGVSGGSVETFVRAGGRAPGAAACAGLDGLLRTGSVDLPFATADLTAPTVRIGIAQAVDAALSPRGRALVSDTIPILYAAQTQGLPAGTLELLDVFFPGRAFAHEAQGLTFRPSGKSPLNPSDGAWRVVTNPPEMLPGIPVS